MQDAMNETRRPSPGNLDRFNSVLSPSNNQDTGPSRVRCRFASKSNSGPGLTHEISCLLRTRWRLAILIILGAFILHFIRNLWDNTPAVHIGPFAVVLQGSAIAVMVAVSAILWSPWPLSTTKLRVLELTIF